MANGIMVYIGSTATEDRATLGSDPSAVAVPYGMGGILNFCEISPFLHHAVGPNAINPSTGIAYQLVYNTNFFGGEPKLEGISRKALRLSLGQGTKNAKVGDRRRRNTPFLVKYSCLCGFMRPQIDWKWGESITDQRADNYLDFAEIGKYCVIYKS